MSGTYTPNVTAQDAIKRHLAEQHAGATNVSSVATVSSATATPVTGLRVAFITGTTTITSLTGGKVGQIVTLHFASSLTFTAGTPLLLAGGSNISATASDTVTLLCTDATVGANVWVQVGTSANA